MARGDAEPDLVITGGSVLSVFTGEVFQANVAIAEGYVAGVGEYDGPRTYDASGQVVIPGFVDGHCHIESSKLSVPEFARAVLARGTTSVVVDPHELANVLGLAGIEYVLDAGRAVPLGVYVTLPSCVPASPFESPAGPLEACDLTELLRRDGVVGLAEMMNYPAAIAGEPSVVSKMAATGYRHVDGHAPGVAGRALNAYLVSGPSSDHECTTLEEALEKRRLGMWIMIREATMIHNLVDLLPLIHGYGTENCMFVTDDREVGTLLDEGHMNSMVRKAVAHGLAAGDAVKLASLQVARYHGLHARGAVAPGYAADLLIVPDLETFEPAAVFKDGTVVAERGQVVDFPAPALPTHVRGTVRVAAPAADTFVIPYRGEVSIRVVELIRDQVVTRAATARPTVRDGQIVADPDRDLAKLAVLERHHATGRVGTGFVRGFGLRRGAFASTIAHDAHNIAVVGMDDVSMATCVRRLAEMGGGLVVADRDAILGELPLEIAGLMSECPAAEVAARLDALERVLATLGGSAAGRPPLANPFMYLGFLALSVIPELRVTDRGIVDVRRFEIVPLGAA